MARGNTTGIPQRSINYFLLCLFGVVIFVFIGILPYYWNLKTLDQDIKRTGLRIEEQKLLAPLFDSLKKRSTMKQSAILPLPERTSLPRDQLSKLSLNLREIAKQHGMEVISLSPDLKSLSADSKSLAVTITVTGEFSSFRKYFLALQAIPYFENMEEMRIRQQTGSTELFMKIWVAVS